MLWRKGGQIFILDKPGQRKREKKGTVPFFSLDTKKGTVPFFSLFLSFNNSFDFVINHAIKQISLRIMNGIGSVYE